jgi:hypothetical protein
MLYPALANAIFKRVCDLRQLALGKMRTAMVEADSTDEARLLQDLLADAHTRIRELQSSHDRLADELLTLRLNDRRHPVGSQSKVEHERRGSGVHAVESQGAQTKAALLR